MEGLKDVSVDKLAIVADDVGNFAEVVSNPFSAYIGNRTHAKFPYRYGWQCSDGTYIQWGDENKKGKPIRIEFNPNRCDLKELRKILTRCKYPELTRCDLTFDFDIDFSDAVFIDFRYRKSNEWRDGTGRLETHYFGCGDPMLIRVYDKAKEQKDDSGGVWWRVEAELRKSFLECYNQYNELADPFEGVCIKIPDTSQIDDFQTRAIVDYLMRNPNEIGNLSKNSRTKYKKILATIECGKVIDMSMLFEQYKPILKKILDDHLHFAKMHDLTLL